MAMRIIEDHAITQHGGNTQISSTPLSHEGEEGRVQVLPSAFPHFYSLLITTLRINTSSPDCELSSFVLQMEYIKLNHYIKRTI